MLYRQEITALWQFSWLNCCETCKAAVLFQLKRLFTKEGADLDARQSSSLLLFSTLPVTNFFLLLWGFFEDDALESRFAEQPSWCTAKFGKGGLPHLSFFASATGSWDAFKNKKMRSTHEESCSNTERLTSVWAQDTSGFLVSMHGFIAWSALPPSSIGTPARDGMLKFLMIEIDSELANSQEHQQASKQAGQTDQHLPCLLSTAATAWQTAYPWSSTQLFSVLH